jgi:hypothetical protein
MAEKELDPNPRSTWGATPEYKRRWNERYGKKEDEAAATSEQTKEPSTPDVPGGAEGNQTSDPLRRTTAGGVTP